MGMPKGRTGNPHGRPPAGRAFIDQLNKALAKVEKEKKISLIEHAVRRAYVDDIVLNALLKKILPDKIDNGEMFKGANIVLIRSNENKT